MNWKQTYGYPEKQIRKFLQATYGDRMYRIAEQYGRKAVFVSNSAQFKFYVYRDGRIVRYDGAYVNSGVPGYTFGGYVSDIAFDMDKEQPEVLEWMLE